MNGERRSCALLTAPSWTSARQKTLREAILRAYEDYEHLVTAEPVGPTSDFARELATAIKAALPVASAPLPH